MLRTYSDMGFLNVGTGTDVSIAEFARLVADAGRGLQLGCDPARIGAVLADVVTQPHRLAGPVNTALIETLSRPCQSLRLLAQLEDLHVRRRAAA